MKVLRVWNDIFISLTQIVIFGWTIYLFFYFLWITALFIMNDLFIHFSSFMCPHNFYQKQSYSPPSYNDASDDVCNSVIPPIQQPVTHMTLPKLATIRHNIDNNPINLHWTKSSLTLFSFERPIIHIHLTIWKKRLQFPLHARI